MLKVKSLALFQSYTLETLHRYGFAVPSGVDGWFGKIPDAEEYGLFLTPQAARCWCYPSINDRTLCFFYSPSGLRFGVDCCQNKHELLSFRTATFGLPIEHSQVGLFASVVKGEWYFLGKTVLGSGFATNGSFNQFDLGLDEKLPEWLWLQFGGYRDWLICTQGDQFFASNAGEADHLLMEYWGTISQTIEITRYKGDSLFAATNTKDDAVIYYHYDQKHLHTLSPSYGAADDEYYGFGDFEFPRQWIIPRQHAIELIRHFLDTGSPDGLVEG